MKKQVIIIIFLLWGVFLVIPSSYAAEETLYLDIKSPKYNDDDLPIVDYRHIGYHYEVETNLLSTTRTTTYTDIYSRKYYRVDYLGVLGTPQMTFYQEYPIVYIGDPIKLTDFGFVMSEDMIHTNSLYVGITVYVNDISGTFGTTWNKIYRYSNNIKIMSELGDNINHDPFVIMPVYEVQAEIAEVVHHGVATRALFGSWSPYTWTTSVLYQKVIIGYIGYYYYLGVNSNNEYATQDYLLNNSDLFTYPTYRPY